MKEYEIVIAVAGEKKREDQTGQRKEEKKGIRREKGEG